MNDDHDVTEVENAVNHLREQYKKPLPGFSEKAAAGNEASPEEDLQS